jgi:acyl-CoA synthetase (AMP-forming)/AMP-acid ligase II
MPQTLPQVIRQAAAALSATRRPSSTASQTLELRRSRPAQRDVARALIAQGVRRATAWRSGRRTAEWILAACGTHMAGAVLVPINTRMKGAEAADILERSRARVLFCIGDFLGQLLPCDARRTATATLARSSSSVRLRRVTGELGLGTFSPRAAVPPAQVHEREARWRRQHRRPDVHQRHHRSPQGRDGRRMRPTIRAFSEWARVVGLGEGDRYLIINPFFHTFGYKAGWVAAFLRGATVYPHQVFDADAVLSRIAADRISFLPGPPTLFLTMLAHPAAEGLRLSSLRSAVTGAASVPPVLIERMRSELGIATSPPPTA